MEIITSNNDLCIIIDFLMQEIAMKKYKLAEAGMTSLFHRLLSSKLSNW
jgi:hypothetical protein